MEDFGNSEGLDDDEPWPAWPDDEPCRPHTLPWCSLCFEQIRKVKRERANRRARRAGHQVQLDVLAVLAEVMRDMDEDLQRPEEEKNRTPKVGDRIETKRKKRS